MNLDNYTQDIRECLKGTIENINKWKENEILKLNQWIKDIDGYIESYKGKLLKATTPEKIRGCTRNLTMNQKRKTNTLRVIDQMKRLELVGTEIYNEEQ